MTGRTYSIIRSERPSHCTVRTVVESGLCWRDADRKREQLAADERAKHPLKSSWVRAVFIVQMEAVQQVPTTQPLTAD